MRIAQVAPFSESVPPAVYNARPLFIHFLTEELVRRGHAMTLFASADSRTSAALVPGRKAEARERSGWDSQSRELEYLDALEQRAGDFDVVHFHTDPVHLPLAARLSCAHLTTVHGTLNSEDHGPLFSEFPATPLVSTSCSQRCPLPWLDWRATIPYGLPVPLIEFNARSGGYLLFLDDITADTCAHVAIDIARRVAMPLKIAGTLHPENQPYFVYAVASALAGSAANAEFIGKLKTTERWRLLTGARALLVPGTSADIGGMVMIEAAACGTPVIALRSGAATDIIEDGVSGRLVTNADEAVRAALFLSDADRPACREVFERRFTIGSVAEAYMQVYRQL
jgi:glycosyltransferase involved in cell wall biosynthesis